MGKLREYFIFLKTIYLYTYKFYQFCLKEVVEPYVRPSSAS